jgi:hypothetical protein
MKAMASSLRRTTKRAPRAAVKKRRRVEVNQIYGSLAATATDIGLTPNAHVFAVADWDGQNELTRQPR